MIASKFYSQGFRPFKVLRLASTQAVKAPDSKFQEEWDSAKPFQGIPMMTKFQTFRSFLPGGKYFNKSMNEVQKAMHDEHGMISGFPALLGNPEILMTFNVNDIEKIFRFEGALPFRRSLLTLSYYRNKVRPDIYGEYGSLISEQNESWHKMRTIVNPVMMKPTTIKLYVPQVDAVSKDFIKMIMKQRDLNNEVPANFNDFINMWSLESIACITLNTRLGLLSDDSKDEKGRELIKLIREFFTMSYDFEAKPSVWRYYETKGFKKLLGVYDGITNTIMQYVDKAVEELESKPSNDDREESILEKLIKINKKVAVVMSADALLAGVDTTSSAAVGVLYCLAKNQDKQEILREEMRKILPNKDDALTPDMMRNMPYLRAVIKEGLRLYPPTSANIRKTGVDLVLSGYRVPKGTEVAMGLMTLYYDDKHFEQASKFIPERWLKASNNSDSQCPRAKDSHPFAYLPFGFGARMCVGRRLAELEIEVLISRIIRDYKIEWNHPEMKVKSVTVNVPDGDLKFKFTEL